MLDLFIYLLIYILISFSILGYGKIIDFKNNNLGILGLKGLFLITILSYGTNFFFKHNYAHNLIFLSLGIFFFLINYKKIFHENKKIILIASILFFILFLGILVYKNHDDFFYYHFGYIYSLINFEKLVGIGNLEHGFRTPSSIFYINSLFFLPYIKYHFLHAGAVYFMGFASIFFIQKIIDLRDLNYNKFLIFILSFSFIFINTIFYRIAEHGTDRSALILIFVLIAIIIDRISSKKNLNFDQFKDYNENILILFFLIISLKSFYLIYGLLFLYWIYKNKNYYFNKKFLIKTIKNRITILFILGLILLFLTNFLNTGCLIYPASFTCYEGFSWSLKIIDVEKMKIWYELWSKAGATPNYRVENTENYLSGLNWLSNWFENYFFNKVSDFLLSIFVIIIFFIFFFFKKNKRKSNFKFLTLYLIFLILFIQWFVSYPALRYGGYTILALIIFFPICSYISQNCNIKNFNKKINLIIILSLIVFSVKNIDRIYDENKKYGYNILKNPYYNLDDNAFFYDKKIKNLIESDSSKIFILKNNIFNK
jgi:hypothetical protein